MSVSERTIRRVVWRRSTRRAGDEAAPAPPPPEPALQAAEAFEIATNDPLLAYLEDAPGAVELDKLDLDSPAMSELRAAGVTLVVPLIANGQLVGLLNVGRRLSDQDYSADDRRLLETLATQAAPAVRVGQLVRVQQAEMRARGRLEQELAVAQLIQQSFLPKVLPDLAGWELAASYRPARAVGGDFYDFIELTDGRIGLVIGDVTDKGVPAAMVMAATRSVLRASAQRLREPGAVLARVNDSLCPDIPENMFVTCFYGVLDPASGSLRYANAGHNVPLVRSHDGSSELRATGMPLGLMPEMTYEERETLLPVGATVLLYSDGLIEAHDEAREMFGTPRVIGMLDRRERSQAVIDGLLGALDAFTGVAEEQEDDITLVVVRRLAESVASAQPPLAGPARAEPHRAQPHDAEALLADFRIHSAAGNEREAMARVAEVLAPLALDRARLERLKTATAEATMNAMEHGNGYDPALDVRVLVLRTPTAVLVRIVDHGGGREIAVAPPPDIDAKLAGLQSPRGWGLFLIEQMVDELRQESDGALHTIELAMQLEGAPDGQNGS